MNVRILHDVIPFGVISTIGLKRDDTFMPVTDTRQVSQQPENSFLAVTNQELTRFVADQNKWTVDPKSGQLADAAISSFILTNEDVLVALKRSYRFFSKDLELIHEIPLHQIVDGLESITQFK